MPDRKRPGRKQGSGYGKHVRRAVPDRFDDDLGIGHSSSHRRPMAFGAPLRFGPAGSTTGTNFANLDGSLQTKLKDKSVFDSWTDGGALASVLAGHPNFCWDNPATAKWIHGTCEVIHGTCEVIHGTTAAYR